MGRMPCHPAKIVKALKKTQKHWAQPVAWLHHFFIHHRSLDRRGVGPFMPAVQCQYHDPDRMMTSVYVTAHCNSFTGWLVVVTHFIIPMYLLSSSKTLPTLLVVPCTDCSVCPQLMRFPVVVVLCVCMPCCRPLSDGVPCCGELSCECGLDAKSLKGLQLMWLRLNDLHSFSI